jgi:hypothetical protein
MLEHQNELALNRNWTYKTASYAHHTRRSTDLVESGSVGQHRVEEASRTGLQHLGHSQSRCVETIVAFENGFEGPYRITEPVVEW